jgi:hypothetical protein
VPRVDRPQPHADHPVMKRSFLIFLAFHPALFHAQAHSQRLPDERPGAVKVFVDHPDHCVYMTTLPETEDPLRLRSFERDFAAALRALRTADAKLSELEALSRLRAMCDEAVSRRP